MTTREDGLLLLDDLQLSLRKLCLQLVAQPDQPGRRLERLRLDELGPNFGTAADGLPVMTIGVGEGDDVGDGQDRKVWKVGPLTA